MHRPCWSFDTLSRIYNDYGHLMHHGSNILLQLSVRMGCQSGQKAKCNMKTKKCVVSQFWIVHMFSVCAQTERTFAQFKIERQHIHSLCTVFGFLSTFAPHIALCYGTYYTMCNTSNLKHFWTTVLCENHNNYAEELCCIT